jgi:diketogulonate reductase-like aldo/keto reductase
MLSKFLSLHNKHLLPLKGLGTATLKNLKTIIPEAITLGYRSIDTAKSYGNEAVIGSALSTLYEKKIIKREELFLSTKIKNVKNIDIEKEVIDSLKNFKTDYLDMALVHWPVGRAENGRPVQAPLHM